MELFEILVYYDLNLVDFVNLGYVNLSLLINFMDVPAIFFEDITPKKIYLIPTSIQNHNNHVFKSHLYKEVSKNLPKQQQ